MKGNGCLEESCRNERRIRCFHQVPAQPGGTFMTENIPTYPDRIPYSRQSEE